nr:PKD domain-containing protein [Zobellia sp. B3R18]
MKLGDEIPPAFTFDPPNATDQEVTVVSSDPDVVLIDENNVCIAVGLGTAEVTVTSVSNPDASDTVTVEVIPPDRVPVTGISVSQADPGATGAQRQLAATVLPENATDPSVTWSSSDDTIATVDENGLLTGLSAGTVTVTATSVSDPEVSGSVLVEITGVSLQSANDIEAFALNGQIETATIDTQAHTVSVTVPEGTALNVAPVLLIVSEGATLAPALLQVRDFTSPVEYTVTSGNGTEQVWTVTAKVLVLPVAGDTDITAFGLPGQNGSDIDTGNHTITVNVPDGTDLNIAPEILEVSPGASVAPAIGQVRDFSGAVAYTVTPETGTPQVWTVNVTVSQPTGSGENAITAFELPGQTGADINATTFTINVTVPDGTDLTGAPSVLDISADATVSPARTVVQDFSGAVTYTVTAENGDTQEWTVNTTVLPPTGSGANDITAFGLPVQNSADIDPDTNTVTVNVPDGTDLNVAPQVLGVSPGATVLPATGVVQDFSGQVLYTVTAENGTPQVWTVNVTVSAPTGSGLNAITGFELPVQNSVAINDVNHTITVNVPNGTDLNVVPSILDISTGAGIDPGPASQQDFSQPVNYTVTAENGNPQVWTVNVVTETSGEKSIDSFVIDGVSGTFNGTDISVTLPFGTDVTALSPIIEFFGQSVNPPSGTPTDFTNNVTYTVTAEDNTTLDYTVNVTVTADTNTAPTAGDFSVDVEQDSNNNSIDLSPYINDADGDELTITIISDFRNGTAIVSGNTIVYTPTSGYTGEDNIVYTVNDGNGGIATATINVTVDSSVNLAPVAVNDTYTIAEAGNLNVLILTNDTDNENNDLTVNWVGGSPANIGQSISGSGGGLFTITAGGNLTFNTNGEFDGLNNGDSQTTTVQYRVTDGNSNSNIATVSVIVTGVDDPNNSPTAVISTSVTSGTTPLSVDFTGNQSIDDDGSIVSYEWEFGENNRTSSQANPTYEYISPGDYIVTLKVTDDDGATNSVTITISVSEPVNEPPTAVISSSATNGTTPLSVDFTGDQSIDDDGSIVSYSWDFGENGQTSALANPNYQYVNPGTFTVTLTVTDNNGATDSETVMINVEESSNQPPNAMGTTSTLTGSAPLSVNFKNLNSTDIDGTIVGTSYNFGDGATINGGFPFETTHIYDTPGTYTATMTVTDNDGATDFVEFTINITGPPTQTISFSNGSNVNPGAIGTFVQGDLIISSGPAVVFEMRLNGGDFLSPEGAELTFTVDGIPYFLYAGPGQNNTLLTIPISAGTHSYSLELQTLGGNGYGSVVKQ